MVKVKVLQTIKAPRGGGLYYPTAEVEISVRRYRILGPEGEGRVQLVDGADPPDPTDGTDAAIHLAEEQGVNLFDIEGTGASGRIVKKDVERYLQVRAEG